MVELLQSDPTMLSVFGNAWDVGYKQEGFYPPAQNGDTGIRIELGLGPQNPKTPDKQGGALILGISCWLPSIGNGMSPNILDCLDVWEAIEAVFYPADKVKRDAIKYRLRELGADTGEPLMSDPMAAHPGNKEDSSWVYVARIQLNISKSLNKNKG